MPFVMNQDIPETNEELKLAFIAECKERQRLESEVECLEKCSLSQEFMEETSAETIKQFEEDCRDNWKELDSLKVKLERIVTIVYGAVGKEVEFEN